ncbi:MAG: Hint domain-containing protein [Patescibacteria group bacterium]
MRIHRSVVIIGTTLSLFLLGFGCTPSRQSPNPGGSDTVFCTQEAKQCQDGSYIGRTGPNCEFADCPSAPPIIQTEINTCNGSTDLSCNSGYVCIQKCGPPVSREGDPEPGYYCELSEVASKPRMCPICLASNTNISTPDGQINVTKIAVGARVWSLNERGERVVATVTKTTRTPVPKGHRVVHLVLSDGRELWVSPNHPTVTGQAVGALHSGDIYDGSRITQADLAPYWDSATYDILPDSFTGAYLANGIWMGSTLLRR